MHIFTVRCQVHAHKSKHSNMLDISLYTDPPLFSIISTLVSEVNPWKELTDSLAVDKINNFKASVNYKRGLLVKFSSTVKFRELFYV